eukprot:jgi/Chrpa1/7624/Chrysochromulina_OHIO_Genome00018241-RA
MDDAVSLTSKRFRFERDSILSGLDYAALAAGYLVTAADMFPTEVPAGAIGGAGTLWIRRSKRSDTIIMKFMNTRKLRHISLAAVIGAAIHVAIWANNPGNLTSLAAPRYLGLLACCL